MPDAPSTLAAALRRARSAAGWTQRELAERAAVHQPQVARAESGADLQLSLLERIARPLSLELALRPLPDAARGADAVDASVDTWRAAWPQVDPEVFAVLARLAQAGRHVEAAIERTAALHGMNGREVMVLGALRRKGAPYESTPTGLKQLLWLSLPGLKKRLDRLEALGMVTRAGNPQDRRGFVVRLTERGHAALDDLVTHPQARVYRALLEMPASQRAELSGLLRSLLVRLEG